MKTLIKVFFILVNTVFINVNAQEDVSGIWQGELSITANQKIKVEFVIREQSNGALSAVLNTPDTGAFKDVKAKSVKFEGDRLNIDLPEVSGKYSGTLNDGIIAGNWLQGGSSMALNLRRFNKPVITPDDYEKVVGNYANVPWADEYIVISTQDSKLFAQPPNQERTELTPVDGGVKFKVGNTPMEVAFIQNAKGEINSFEIMVNGSPRPATTRIETLKAEYKAVSRQVRPNGLSDAVLMDDIESAKVLIEAGIDIHELDTRPGVAGGNGRRPLNHAALRNRVKMIELLLDAGAEINRPNNSGFTPLHHAAEGDAPEAAGLLVERGADLSLIARNGMTPRELAEAVEHHEVLKILEDAEEGR